MRRAGSAFLVCYCSGKRLLSCSSNWAGNCTGDYHKAGGQELTVFLLPAFAAAQGHQSDWEMEKTQPERTEGRDCQRKQKCPSRYCTGVRSWLWDWTWRSIWERQKWLLPIFFWKETTAQGTRDLLLDVRPVGLYSTPKAAQLTASTTPTYALPACSGLQPLT